MEKFCFGALARILHYCCKLGVKQYELGEGLLKVFNEVYGEYFTEKPARSCVAVKTLPKNVLCEVEVIAEREA